MRRFRKSWTHEERPPEEIDGALEDLEAAELRELVREHLRRVEPAVRGTLVDAIVHRAAREGSTRLPEAPGVDEVEEIVAFAASSIGTFVEPRAVESRLRRASIAFFRKDYPAARRIFAALLPPLASAGFDLGEDEMVDEVLSVDLESLSAQYAVSVYATTEPAQRARTLRDLLGELERLAAFAKPIAAMERAALEPLPDLDAFLPEWHRLLGEELIVRRRGQDWQRIEERWRLEATERLRGLDGLADLARSTRRGSDFHAWTRALAVARDWVRALAAFEEAAASVRDRAWRADFLDGAALAAQELEDPRLPEWLEKAWRAEPRWIRLRHWLDTAHTPSRLRSLAKEALPTCPRSMERQRALLHVLLGEFEEAAALLTAAPGLGWSSEDHPGPLLVPLFRWAIEAGDASSSSERPIEFVERDPPDLIATSTADGPRLRAPALAELLDRASVRSQLTDSNRAAMLAALRHAAEKRVQGVVREKRRRHYGHAAELVATCAALDRSPAGERWLIALREEHRRYPALQVELDAHLDGS